MHLLVENPNLERVPIGEVPGLRETGVVVSRIRAAGESGVKSATESTALHVGDVILAVGTRHGLEQFRRVVGSRTDEDLTGATESVTYRRLVVTHKDVLGKTIGELGLGQLYGVTMPRLRRAEVEMTAQPHIRLQFGDVVAVVGPEAALDQVAKKLGNSLKALNETQFIPIFLGIALGVVAGVQPFNLLGLPVPVRLGLAGGPLLVAIVLGRLGQIGRLVWYMPATTNLAFRELGITLFLACVGLDAGERFVSVALSATGLRWLLAGAAVTFLPLLAIGILARAAWRTNFVTLCGLLAGSMTDPPALAFANALAGSDAPTVSYATVYPLTMLLRILVAQVLAIALCT
jgi:putative transport protein